MREPLLGDVVALPRTVTRCLVLKLIARVDCEDFGSIFDLEPDSLNRKPYLGFSGASPAKLIVALSAVNPRRGCGKERLDDRCQFCKYFLHSELCSPRNRRFYSDTTYRRVFRPIVKFTSLNLGIIDSVYILS